LVESRAECCRPRYESNGSLSSTKDRREVRLCRGCALIPDCLSRGYTPIVDISELSWKLSGWMHCPRARLCAQSYQHVGVTQTSARSKQCNEPLGIDHFTTSGRSTTNLHTDRNEAHSEAPGFPMQNMHHRKYEVS
jgi:hypothetical protein